MNLLSFPSGSFFLGGYAGSLIELAVHEEYLDEEKYHLFASQFALHSDRAGSWRGEFWGKFLRCAVSCYKATHNRLLYGIIERSVFEIVSYMEKDGTLSSYIPEDRLTGWDMWCRKYAMIGLLSYLEISKNQKKKAKALHSLCLQADSILAKVGPYPGQKGILKTSSVYGSLNSASILGVYVDLYSLTKKQEYLDFASYIISTGLSEGENLIENALKEGSYPYQWKATKAYEMIACFQGVLHYGEVTNDERCVAAVKSFVKKVAETDFTITGGIGTESEFFNDSSLKQTCPSVKPGSETCVTVSFMALCDDLLKKTGDPYYASLIETMAYNNLFGATNDENQKMNLAEGRVWRLDGYDTPPHEPFLFDSYSPVVSDRRAKVVGGYMRLQNERSYGCCAANGGFGLGLVRDFAFLKEKDGYVLNFYNDFKAKDVFGSKNISFLMQANLYKKGRATLRIRGQGERFRLSLRLPSWAKLTVKLNGQVLSDLKIQKGYVILDRVWGNDRLTMELPLALESVYLNDKIAFKRGPIVLATDSRFGSFDGVISSSLKGKLVPNDAFKTNETLLLSNGMKLCDYASAAKNMDDKDSKLTVWMDISKK